ncbi:MAG TPA: hypothetical protein VMT03_10910 [Polyangia bacterium]|nr:hypothetical protein [Polyangia bacterium]
MNFFGHAAVARQVDEHPAFLLGAMAPDLLGMCGATPGPATSPQVAAGLAHHLAVDAAFHASPTFVALQLWAVRGLVQAGLRRGPARGAAHVGIELLLDGVLSRDRQAQAAYQRSLAAPEPFEWQDATSAARWQKMVGRLLTGAIPDGYRQVDFVAQRVAGALGHRPRLALDGGETAALRAFLPALQTRVVAEAAGLVAL